PQLRQPDPEAPEPGRAEPKLLPVRDAALVAVGGEEGEDVGGGHRYRSTWRKTASDTCSMDCAAMVRSLHRFDQGDHTSMHDRRIVEPKDLNGGFATKVCGIDAAHVVGSYYEPRRSAISRVRIEDQERYMPRLERRKVDDFYANGLSVRLGPLENK